MCKGWTTTAGQRGFQHGPLPTEGKEKGLEEFGEIMSMERWRTGLRNGDWHDKRRWRLGCKKQHQL